VILFTLRTVALTAGEAIMVKPEPAPREGPQHPDERRYMGESLALSLALQDALSDLVQVHGIGYLDKFLERRMRRTVNALRAAQDGSSEGSRAMQAEITDAGEAALRHAVEAVRRNPDPVT
jgi:hypothetical protein